MDKKRYSILTVSALLHNANFRGFFTGKIYAGPLKQVCVPGLNCYSCPGAVGACPIGSLQNFLSGRKFRFPYYVLGLLIFFGALLGRAVCGLLCPFGFLQELLHHIPFPCKRDRFRGDRALRYVKYGVLVGLVIVLPLVMTLVPAFCKYFCPAGTLAGLLLAVRDSTVAAQLGGLFTWKLCIFLGILFACLVIWRPFCKYFCPLGAIYAFFNRISLYSLSVDADKCVHCGKCAQVCHMCVDPSQTPDSPECIRCGQCQSACPTQAIQQGWNARKKADSK